MNRWLACVGVVVVCADVEVFAQDVVDANKESAENAKAGDASSDEAREEAARDAQVFRVNVGGYLGNLNAGGLAAGGTGTLGSLGPTVSLGAGPRLTGPLWLEFGLEASYFQAGGQAEEEPHVSVWGAAGSVALRLDVPILPKVEIGGSFTPRINAQFGSSWEQLSVSGHLGAGLHLRPTDFFGIRTDLELFRVGYARHEFISSEGIASDPQEVFAAELYAGPSVSLTFSF